MNMRAVADFIPFVEGFVASDSDRSMLEHAVREALRQFLVDSRAAVATHYTTQECNEESIYLELAQCHRLVGIDGIFTPAEGCPAHLWSPRWACIVHGPDLAVEQWQHDMADGDRLSLFVPAAKQARRLAVRYTWTTKRDAGCTVPDWVYEDYAHAIAAGALELLHRNPVDQMAAPQMGQLQDAKFRAAVADAFSRKQAMYGALVRYNTASAKRAFFGG